MITLTLCIVSNFWHAGIYAALGLLDNDDDELPDYDVTSVESNYDSCDEDQLSQGECISDSTVVDVSSNKHHTVKKSPLTVEKIFTPMEDEYSN